MTTTLPPVLSGRFSLCAWFAAVALAATALSAQSPAPRISAEVSSSEMAVIAKSKPFVQPSLEVGRVPADKQLSGITIMFNRSAAQEADLQALIANQQNPASPLFHQWLTPEEFAARFGMAQSDLDKVQTWLEQQGFTIDSVGRSRTMIHFSGSVGQVEQAFQTQLHYYNVNGAKHFTPSTAISLPAAIASVIDSVRNLNDFKPHPMRVPVTNKGPRPSYGFPSTSGGQVELFAPGDIKVAYDINTLLGAGTNGSGQTIAVMGQSAIALSDIENFQSAAGLTVKDPTITIVPNTGSSIISTGDEGESDIDLEWSGAIAPGATIELVYTGSTSAGGVFDSIAYAIDEKIGNIISISYGSCEPLLGGSTLETSFTQALTQGQTVIASSGDTGSTGCSNPLDTSIPTSEQQELAVNYPASSPNVTAVGGTEISVANDAVGTYWTSDPSTNSVLLETATQWIPEIAWNDDALTVGTSPANGGGLSASGGGVSTLFPQPSYQTTYFSTTGEANPNSSFRLVPDVALYASPNYPGYLFCTSDTSDISDGLPSCGSGQFYDTNGAFTVAGGTSFGAPTFAGMVAILSQDKGFTSGLGLLNTEIYSLAATSATYSSAFHDVTSGNNDCTAGTTYGYCPSNGASLGYSAGTGYDEVTGLGSVNLGNLASAWPAATTSLIGTTTAVSATTTTPTTGQSDTFTITVTSASGSTAPSGTVALTINGGSTQTLPLVASGTASSVTYTTSFPTAGSYSVVAQYSGDTTHATSTGTLSVTVSATSSGKGTIGLSSSPTTLTVAQGSSGPETITVTPASGYTGTVNLSFDTSNDTALTNLCFEWANATDSGMEGAVSVSGSSAVPTTLTLDANASDCATAAVAKRSGQVLHRFGSLKTASNRSPAMPAPMPLTIAFAGLALAGCLARNSRKLRSLAVVVGLLGVGLALSACGGGNNGNTTVPNPPQGTYTVTVTGMDSATSTITATTSFTFKIN